MTQRLKRHPFLALFDGADPNASTPQRRLTTVPTQALFFLNDPFVHQQAAGFVTRLNRPLGQSETERIRRAYECAFGREPTAQETREAAEFLTAYQAQAGAVAGEPAGWCALARVMFASNEFLTVP